MSRRLRLSSVIIVAVASSGCGGGGSSDVKSTPAPSAVAPTSLPNPLPNPATTPSTTNFDTAEYRGSSAAVGANAIVAWQQGATGKGVTIGFVDTGLVPTLSDFAGRIHSSSGDVNGNRPMDDLWGHGTAIAGIAAAARGDAGMQGIAFDATIFMAKADEGCPENCSFPVKAVVKGIDAARLAGAKVINLSIGSRADGDIADAVRRAVDAGIIVVIAAGNSGSAPSGLASSLASMSPGQVIVVGGLGRTNPDGTINYNLPSVYTSEAGSTQSSFLSAPGWLNSATYFRGGGIDLLSGTSFAAPVVSGAVALLSQAYPMLTPQQIVLLLYVSADDLGTEGTDAIFGRGRLNIGRAFQPVGTTRMANSFAPVPAAVGRLPFAAGDAAWRGGLHATVLDGFNRPFVFDLSAGLLVLGEGGPLARSGVAGLRNTTSSIGPIALAFTVDESRATSMASLMSETPHHQAHSTRLLAALATVELFKGSSAALGFGISSSTLRDSLAHHARDGFMLSGIATARLGFEAQARASSAFQHRLGRWRASIATERGNLPTFDPRDQEAHYSLTGISIDRSDSRSFMRLNLTKMVEPETVLGGRMDVLFGRPGATTWFADVELERRLGAGWSVNGSYRRGSTKFASGHFVANAFSIDLTKEGLLRSNDKMVLRLAQPLRIRQGTIGVTLPTSWDYLTSTATEAVRTMSLNPSGREITAEAGYERRLQYGSISLHVYGRRDPGHVRAGNPDLGVAVRTRIVL